MRNLFRQSSRRHQRRLPSTLSAEVQSLEQRTLPAGTVLVVASAGNITLTGDNNSNQITIEVTATGITLTGTDGTLIRKGARTGTTFTLNTPNVTRDVTINLRGGNDELTVNVGTANLVIGRNLKIDAGAGDDTITVPDDTGSITINGTLTVDLGSGADTLTTTTPITVLGNVKITGSTGNDTVDLTSFETAQHLTIETGSGDDAVVLRDSRVTGNVNVALSAGDDDLDTDNLTVGLDSDDRTVGGATIFDGGSGSDELNLVDSIFAGIARISLQTGSDTLALDSEFRGVLEVTSGAGNDDVLIGNANFQANVSIKLEAGNDELMVNSAAIFGTGVVLKMDGGVGMDTVPFVATGIAKPVVQPNGTVLNGLFVNVTNLGMFTGFSNAVPVIVDGVVVSASGTQVLTATDGSQLNLFITGDFPDGFGGAVTNGTYNITGGTGRFAGASGNGVFLGEAVVDGARPIGYIGLIVF